MNREFSGRDQQTAMERLGSGVVDASEVKVATGAMLPSPVVENLKTAGLAVLPQVGTETT